MFFFVKKYEITVKRLIVFQWMGKTLDVSAARKEGARRETNGTGQLDHGGENQEYVHPSSLSVFFVCLYLSV